MCYQRLGVTNKRADRRRIFLANYWDIFRFDCVVLRLLRGCAVNGLSQSLRCEGSLTLFLQHLLTKWFFEKSSTEFRRTSHFIKFISILCHYALCAVCPPVLTKAHTPRISWILSLQWVWSSAVRRFPHFLPTSCIWLNFSFLHFSFFFYRHQQLSQMRGAPVEGCAP